MTRMLKSCLIFGLFLLAMGCSRGEDAAQADTGLLEIAGAVQADAVPGKISYNRDIRPILSDKCFACHGPDSAAREAELRLDKPTDGEDYFGAMLAIEPGDPEASELIHRIHSKKSKVVMPPPSFKVTLTDQEKVLLERWIEQGAEYEPHWSFVSLPDEVAVPQVKDERWVRDALDRFVLARLEQEGMSPNKEAPRVRWLRRVSYDLTGLPPTPQQVQAFVKDQNEDAYERVVDRLLASEHYGEHMAGQWIDLARYADSYGYQSDLLSPTWPWRDWAIRAFNNNLPYDQFLTQQLAGDLLPHATRDQELASAFNRLHRMTNEGGSINEEWLNEYAADRVHTFGTAFMGLTLECARCHDHRYDPIEQTEYYELYAFFNSIDEWGMYNSSSHVPTPTLLLPDEAQDKRLTELRQKVKQAEQKLQVVANETSDQTVQTWLKALSEQPADQTSLKWHYAMDAIGPGNVLPSNRLDEEGEPSKAGKTHPANTIVEGKVGQALLFAGDTHATFEQAAGGLQPDIPFTVSFWIKLPKQYEQAVVFHNSRGTDTGFHGGLVSIEEGKLRFAIARFWPGNAIAVQTTQALPIKQWTHITITHEGLSSAAGMAIYVDGERVSETTRDNLTKLPGHGGNRIVFDQRFRSPTLPGTAIDELSIYDRALHPIEVKAGLAPKDLKRVLQGQEPETVKDFYLRVVDGPYGQAKRAVIAARRELLAYQTGLLEVPVMQDLPEPTPAYNLARGAYDAPQTEENRVHRAVPDALPPMPEGAPRNRLGLAQWLTDPGHPLTARVAMNRLWMQCFGHGLVATPDDFGLQGTMPIHAELFDYLSRQYIESGWDTKALLKRLVLSATYRQDSSATPRQWADDPDNERLARGPSRRLSGEMLRDSALFASGLLNDKLGGPPVAPYQPPKLWRESNGMSPAYKQSVGKDLYRRSLYTVWKRTAPMPNMLAFDSPTREVCTAERSNTNTPMQALVLLNDVQFVEACRVLTERTLKAEADDKARLDRMFTLLTARGPDAREQELLLGLLDRQRQHYQSAKDEAAKLRKQGEAPHDQELEDAEVAAWITVAQAIMNADATVWRR